MAKLNLDLSKFKKTAEDSQTATMRHQDGHEIRISKRNITDDMRKKLAALPLHKQGGGPPDMDPQSPETADNGEGSMPTAEDTAAAEGPAPTAEDTAAAEGDDEGAPIQPTGIPPKPAIMPQAGEITVTGQKRPDFSSPGGGDYSLGVDIPPPSIPTPQEMTANQLGFASDMQMGKITPQTYASMFASKDTLGKLGTIFGMILSGGGSGLAHQPNVLLGMMDKEIDRDLDAQKSGNINAQHWYQLSLQHELQNAQMTHMQYQNAATLAGIGTQQAQALAAEAAAYEHATAGDLAAGKLKTLGGAKFNLSASNATRNYMLIGFPEYLQQSIINALPPGAIKNNAQQINDTVIRPAAQAKVQENNVKTHGTLSLLPSGFGPTANADTYGANLSQQTAAKGGPGNAIRYDLLANKVTSARNKATLGLPPAKGDVPESEVGPINQEAQMIEDNRTAYGIWHHAFTKLQNAPLKGSGALNEQLYNAETSTVGPEVSRETAGRFNMNEANKQSSGLFPSWNDFLSGAGPEKFNNGTAFFKGRENGTSTLNRHADLKTPFPELPSPFAKDDAARAWAKAHPNDPRAAQILQKLGGQ
jgi:hypothetical protein